MSTIRFMHARCTMVFIAVIVQLFVYATTVAAQAEILSISSFQECIQVDPSSLNDISSNGIGGTGGVGKFLDCSSPVVGDYDTVTIMDLRLQAGTSGAEVFLIDLTTVRPINSSSQTSSNPNGCSPDFTQDGTVIPTDCQLTNSTYAIHIESTEYIYYYDLVLDRTVDIPYCHVTHIADTATTQCNHPQYEGPNNGYQQYTSSCDTRVEETGPCTGSATAGRDNGAASCAYWMDKFSTDKIYSILTGKNEDGSAVPLETLQEYYYAVSPTNNTCGKPNQCVRTEFSSDIFRKWNPPQYTTSSSGPRAWDDYSSLALGEMFGAAAWTDHKLGIPNPIPWGLDQSGKYNPGNRLQILNCLGSCEGNKQNCYNGYDNGLFDNSPSSLRTNGTVLGSSGVDVALFALGPTCSVFRAQLSPQVAMKVTLSMTDLSTNITTTVVTDNVRPGSQESDEFKQIGFEIISVGSLNNVLGPPLGGAFVICGEEEPTYTGAEGKSFKFSPKFSLINPPPGTTNAGDDTPVFPSMRTRWAQADELDNILYNPWEHIIQIATNQNRNTNVYYPSNRWLSFSEVCGNDGSTIDDGSGRPCIPANYAWYYIPPERLHTIGRGCGQIGITDAYWNVGSNIGGTLDSQFASDVCNSDPFICTPGFKANIQVQFNGTEDVVFVNDLAVTGCMAAAVWEIMHDTKGTLNTPNGFDYWEAQPINPIDPTDGPTLNTYEKAFSRTVLNDITKRNMPPFYSPERPNYWFQKESDTEFVDGYRVYYEPDPKQVSKFPLSFEMTIYFVGKFIGYGEIVPSGLIVQDAACTPDPSHPTFSDIYVQVQNTGRTPGDYTLFIDCPVATLVEAVPPQLFFTNVTAGTISPLKKFQLAPINDDDANVASDDCVLTLTATADVFTQLDVQSMEACDFTVRSVNGTPPPAKPYSAPPGANGTSCGLCAFQCWHDHGGIMGDPCFWFIVIPFVIFGSLLALTGAQYIWHRFRMAEQIKQGAAVRAENQRNTRAQMNDLMGGADADEKVK